MSIIIDRKRDAHQTLRLIWEAFKLWVFPNVKPEAQDQLTELHRWMCSEVNRGRKLIQSTKIESDYITGREVVRLTIEISFTD